MSELVFLLEEESARAMLESLLPRILPEDLTVRYITFEGKSDLDRQIVRRLKYYQVPGAKFVILRDKDSGDCFRIKEELVAKCRQAGRDGDTLVRIACHELESWYLGDLDAVEEALDINGISKKQTRANYRSPDKLGNAAQELSKLTNHQYRKVGSSRLIGLYLDLEKNKSDSFRVFISGVKNLIRGPEST